MFIVYVMYACMYMCRYMCMCVYVYVCVCVYIFIWMYTYVLYMCMYVYLCMYAYTSELWKEGHIEYSGILLDIVIWKAAPVFCWNSFSKQYRSRQ